MKIQIVSALLPTLLLAVSLLSQSHDVQAQSVCTATGSNLDLAKSAYTQQCPSIPRVDCDPVDGEWMCSSGVIGTSSPGTSDSSSSTSSTFSASTITAARQGFNDQFGTSPRDCDPINGQWVCSSDVIGVYAPDGGTTGGDGGSTDGGTTGGSTDGGTTGGSTDGGTTGGSTDGATVITSDLPTGSLFATGDFIFLQYDSCPDPDDLHAAVAGRMVVDKFGLQLGTDYAVVNGTCGEDRDRSDYIERSPELFTTMYGAEGSINTWLNSFDRYDNSVNVAAAKIRETLDVGQDVFIIEGGPHDFTSDVIRKVKSDGYTQSLTGRVFNIQHSAGFNIGNTNDANMEYVRNNLSFIQIDNGNVGGNDTPQLNQWNTSNTGYEDVDDALVAQYRDNSVYGSFWQSAFSIFDPTNRFDGSDTVELLWAFNIKSNVIADWYDFATTFLPSGTTDGGTTGGDGGTSGAILSLEAEDGIDFSGSGWVVESSRTGASEGEYIVWRGANKFRVTDADGPEGVKAYDFVVAIAGVYQFEATVQSRIGNESAAGDADNDAWMKFTTGTDTDDAPGDVSKWTKFFHGSAPTTWSSYSNGEQYDPTFFTGIYRELSVGTHRVLIGGRSTRFGIDSIGLSLRRATDTTPIVATNTCLATTAAQLTACIADDANISLMNDITVSSCPAVITMNGQSNVSIDGNGFTILRTDNQRSCNLVDITASQDISIFNITLDDDATDAACVVDDGCANMVRVTNSSNISFDDTHIQYGKGYVVYTSNVNGFSFTNGSLRNSGVLGMYIGHESTPSSNILIDSNEFTDNSTNALAVLGGTDVVITNNTFRRNHNPGQWPVAPQFGTGITGGGQMYIARGTNILIEGNTIADGSCSTCVGGIHGIEVSVPNESSAVNNLTIRSNVIENNTGTGIYLNTGASVATTNIIDNTYTNNAGIISTGLLDEVTDTPAETPVTVYAAAATTREGACALFDATYPDETWKDSDPVGTGFVCANVSGKVLSTSDITIGSITTSVSTSVDDTPVVVAPTTNTWVDRAAMNVARVEATSVEYNGDLYVFNGFKLDAKIANSVEKYDESANTWTIVSTTSTTDQTAVTHNGIVRNGADVYILGGRIGDHPGTVSSRVWIFNLDSLSWRRGVDLPTQVAGGGAALVNNQIHWFGGLDVNASCDVGNHYVYPIGSSAWIDITADAAMPNPRNHFATTVVDDIIYAIGGQYGHDNCPLRPQIQTNLVHSFDPATNTWTSVASLPNNNSHAEPGTFAAGGDIFSVGGAAVKDKVLRFDVQGNSWSTFSTLPESLLAPAARFINGKLVVAGGGAPSAFTATNRVRSLDVDIVEDVPDVVVAPVTGSGETINGINVYTDSTTRAAATAGFVAMFGSQPVDCDPVGDGYVCSSIMFIGDLGTEVAAPVVVVDDTGSSGVDTNGPVAGTNTTGVISSRTDDNVRTHGAATRTPGGISWADSFAVDGKCYIRSGLDHGADSLVMKTPYGDKTIGDIYARQQANGSLSKYVAGQVAIYNDVQCGNGPENDFDDEDVGQCPGRVDGGMSQCNQIGPLWDLDELYATSSNEPSTTYQTGDLLSIHWDSSLDPDDLQAMIAAREILDSMPSLQEGTDYITTNGTKKWENSTLVSGSTEHMLTMFPQGRDANGGSEAFNSTTVAEVASVWETTLLFGGTIFVAEGGPADFTAAVVRRIAERRTVYGYKNRIRIIQHSTGWNEENTRTSELELIQNLATYIRIQDGNHDNLTPDWESGTGDSSFRTRALTSQYGDEWALAFGKIDNKVDFSDGVELYEIFGIAKSEAPTPAVFADKYF